MTATFIRFRETCEAEGESWTFWLQVEGNEDALNELDELIEAADVEAEETEGYSEPAFLLIPDADPERIVDKLVQYSDSGYMNSHNKIRGRLDVEPLHGKPWEKVYDLLYKGGITDLFTEEQS